ncbi:hypothetical protein EJ05DRAFT_523908 [Pseudovirgaria hyperparasitica]|uniref:Vacuolar protein sorting-associated protein 51 homolog n=1 Tax=Pseudovirgaria hyperparasitica TaxID=470096 RepID=A0A6A6WFG7_9PEZI|nr:uncharacterized protein EJ05DRAFT_523908 [Pseudovirgaria hyperparasitica]KAF2760740.1 hypothetical protein EJ05DRAFT_523908 [Pseudovirgaria hyperparasitica]
MSTISSPRASSAVRSPAGSVRTSMEAPRPGTTRRNRAALRDYYNIKVAETTGEDKSSEETVIREENVSELDRDGFDPEAYVKDILANQGLEEVLKVEAGLMSEIRGLDGEKKALVYDNYSKLITATDTIRKGQMRTNMDPMTPSTSTLAPAVSHIAETAATLSTLLNDRTPPAPELTPNTTDTKSSNAKQTVRWVLDAPRRLAHYLEENDRKTAEEEWVAVQGLLNKWKGTEGVEEIRARCEEALSAD